MTNAHKYRGSADTPVSFTPAEWAALNGGQRSRILDLQALARAKLPHPADSATLTLVKRYHERRDQLKAAGKCPDCEGRGHIGGQFSGGYQPCEACNSTGRPIT